ncbi:MAG: amino acid permease [Proteobacteria bacterium]|uniref:APC family permease n=1 Tax=Rudaea sp. TaxID=2136325 RepID=UPI001DB7D7D0|nr:amino acid permease [Pseudomonadota bacterium]MBS0567047.1 amino acid permease [Pseudomonadota bacterium]
MSEQPVTASAPPAPGYLRRLGVWDASMIVVGGVIGSGIFRVPAAVAKQTGSGAEQLVAWAIGGVIALIGALSYAELGARRPNAGGGYVYLREAFGLIVAFVYGWNLLVVNHSGAIAAVSTVFVEYFGAALGVKIANPAPWAVGTIVFLTGINWFGIRAGSWLQNVLTVLKLLALALLIAVGLAFGGAPAPATPPPPLQPLTFIGALMPVLFSYGGWYYVNDIAGEIRDPRRNLPRALVLGMLLVATCYVLANAAYLAVLGHAGLAASAAPAADAMRQIFGEPGARLIALGIAISTLGFVNISLAAAARVFQVMASDGVFFRFAATLHPRWHSPNVALLMLAAWACVLALTGTFEQLLNYSTVGDWIGIAAVIATLFWYRRRCADDAAAPAFRVPLYPLLPIFFLVVVAWVVATTVWENPHDAGMGVLITLVGIPIYWYWTRRRRTTDTRG